MNKREFHSISELEQVKGQLATASRHPVYVSNSDYQEPGADEDLVRDTDPSEVDELIELRNKSVLWNERDRKAEYISSDDYTLVQHSEVLDMVQEALSKTVGDIEMGVIRDYGSQIDGTLVFSNIEEASINVEDIVDTEGYIPPEGDVDPRGSRRARDTLGLGMRTWNSFDGMRKIGASTMGYRFICQNWMVWGEEEIASTQSAHIGELNSEFFEEVIAEVFEIRDEVSDIIRDSENEEIPFEWVPSILEQAGFGPTYQKRITGRVLIQNTPRAGYSTSWRLYNAATSELDNRRAENIKKQSYDKYQKASWELLGEPTEPEEEMSMEEMDEFALID